MRASLHTRLGERAGPALTCRVPSAFWVSYIEVDTVLHLEADKYIDLRSPGCVFPQLCLFVLTLTISVL